MGVFEKLLKYSFAVVTLLIFIIGVILLGLGIHEMVSDADTVGENTDINLGQGEALFLTIVGGTVTLVSFLGCCGAFTVSGVLMSCIICTYSACVIRTRYIPYISYAQVYSMHCVCLLLSKMCVFVGESLLAQHILHSRSCFIPTGSGRSHLHLRAERGGNGGVFGQVI